MKMIFPYSLADKVNPKFSYTSYFEVIDVQLSVTKTSGNEFKIVKFQAVEKSPDSIQRFDLTGFRIIWNQNQNKPEKRNSRPLFYNDFDFNWEIGSLFNGAIMWEIYGIKKYTGLKQRFYYVFFGNENSNNNVNYLASRQLYYLGYNLELDDKSFKNYDGYKEDWWSDLLSIE